jgi:hypothetical protein
VGGSTEIKREWNKKEKKVEQSIMENSRVEELGQRKAIPVTGRESP